MDAGAWLNNPEVLEIANKVVGVLIALIGAALAAPTATAQSGRTVAAKIALRPLQLIGSLLRRLGRLLGMKSEGPNVRVHGAQIKVEGLSNLNVGGRRDDWLPGTPIGEQVLWLRDAYRNLETAFREVKVHNDAEHKKTRQELESLAAEFTKKVETLETFITEENAKSVQVQAIGLGPIAIGIILSGIPEILAAWGIVGWIILVAAIIVTILALKESVRQDVWDADVKEPAKI
ncbi:hypothetical protein [Pseudarthrobacter scleromae]|uniref:hypothetical protein n=1 Tax=Pseudarthrobacter scleromae TaxID=158897 RepID=UPI003D058AA6